ncbi:MULTISPECIES: aminotransferase class V-fold PLP-dependent enzyme [Haloarcula]|jgi:selenocysteine lyase/cysteine desulfurase|uniref:Aminotransferase class V-fold PLP-dependent enzyme n=2 Tax=Haloarcula marismortui TaxID=2238 RepID=Q5V074_HALMA|nr:MULTISPECIES: aminotransferase class V-fold PLP-dependent enzyme [Haloarcula]AAV47079.1 probable cysteine desulfurase [Haloarcula marismortui ATCC 43049]EMA16554.1 cysteine desulfurase [Haloarcula californiae ATCC 33799]NHX40190.1 aminotransferase class V-fold PLP-dependent enzyme [Haloarcula sp. R1-2]QCP91779.1 aminotransferase class V-fold PLP-dependent enzyme [Haloarcula marismortui ATCC 43049]
MDPVELRASIPALERCTYFNTGASGPTPRPVVDAATAFLERHAFDAPADEGPYTVAWDAIAAAREVVASHIGTDAANVALTRSTADGVNMVAGAIDWQPGDVVVRTDLEHPAGTLPWDRLADTHDIEVRVLETDGGRLDMAEVKDAVADARLVALSSLSWTHGTRLPVADVVAVAHDAGAQVLVDAVQSVGQHPVDVTEWGADFVAAAGHKWLLGVWGGGFLYVDPDAYDRLRQTRIGYRSVENPGADGYKYHEGARRFEVGTTSPVPYVALANAIETVEAIGFDTIQPRVERLTDRLKDGLGDRLLSPRDYESGLVTFTADDPEATVERLAAEGIIIRSLPNPDALRASVHAFNTADDVDRLLDAL